MTQPFRAEVRNRNGAVTVELHGDINSAADDALHAAYREAEGFAPPAIFLDFVDVNYINSTGIALIVSLLAQARKTGRRLVVYGLSDHYVEIFKITRLIDFISVFPDETTALAEMQV